MQVNNKDTLGAPASLKFSKLGGGSRAAAGSASGTMTMGGTMVKDVEAGAVAPDVQRPGLIGFLTNMLACCGAFQGKPSAEANGALAVVHKRLIPSYTTTASAGRSALTCG
jgi:hypothetical protein